MTASLQHTDAERVSEITESMAREVAGAMETHACPTWCVKQHVQEVAELEPGEWRAAQSPHTTPAGAEYLRLIAWGIGGEGEHVEREAGGSYELSIVQWPNRDHPDLGFDGPPLLALETSQKGTENLYIRKGTSSIALTSGESRVLAARLVAAADRMDGLES